MNGFERSLINIRNKKDLITLDLRTQQMRYLVDIKNRGFIWFIRLGHDDIDGYRYLFKNDRNLFLSSMREDIKSNTGIDVKIKDLVIE